MEGEEFGNGLCIPREQSLLQKYLKLKIQL